MKKNDDLWSLTEVCEYFGLSESTIRRKIRDSRDGTGNFPLPLFGSKSRVLFKKDHILNYEGEDAEVIRFNPLPIQPTQPVRTMSNAQVDKELAKLGVRLPAQSDSGK